VIPYRRLAAIVVALILVLAVQATAFAAILVIPEPGADPAHVALVREAADAFTAIVAAELGVTLDNDVRLFVCPTGESYRAVLVRELRQRPDLAARAAEVTAGMSGGRIKAVAVNFGALNGGTAGVRACKTAAHELFHQLQYQLAGHNLGKSFYWLKEGAADLFGAAVAEKLGYQSLDQWKLDRLDTLRQAGDHVSPQEILATNLDKWTGLLEDNRHPYEIADLLVLCLMDRTQPGGRRAIGEYYRLLGQGLENGQAFERAFAIRPENLVAGFRTWFAHTSARAAGNKLPANAAN
jgi:hypothetical protein